jgi:hypothetical protein
MKSVWEKTKRTLNSVLDFLVKNHKSFYACCIILILSMLWNASTHIKASAAVLEVQKEALIVINEQEKLGTVKDEIILLQKEIIQKQNQQLLDGMSVLKMQEELIKKLIQRIKELTYDPDFIT